MSNSILQEYFKSIEHIVECKDTQITGLQDSIVTINDRLKTEQDKSEELYIALYAIRKQLKSLNTLLTKDSIKKMSESELRKTIAVASGMVTNAKNKAENTLDKFVR